jgi:SAM-dependent methyltransferase
VDLTSRRDCPICKRDNRSQPVLGESQRPWELKMCAGCGLVYLENPPAYQSLEREFAWEKIWAEENARRRRRNPISYHLSRTLLGIPKRLLRRDKLVSWLRCYVHPGPVLDVGCAGGHTLQRLAAGYIPFGIEVSKELACAAQSRFTPRGGRVAHSTAIAALPEFKDEFFTGVIMSSYLEHEVNPRAALQAVRKIMQPQARLVVKVPNYASFNRRVCGARWCGFRFPHHVNYFTPSLLIRLVQEAGFRVIRFGLRDRMPTSDNMWLLAEKT